MRSVLAALEPELEATFGRAAVARLGELAAPLPAFSVSCLECRLARPGGDVDLSVYVPRAPLRWPSALLADPRWARVLRIADTASFGASVGTVRGAWLEMDAGGATSPLPSIFFHVEGPPPTPATLLSLASRLGVPRPPDAATLARCLAALPASGPVHLQIGAMIPREEQNARLVLHGVTSPRAVALARDLGWRDDEGSLERTLTSMERLVDRVSIALELGETIGNRLAVEGQISDQGAPRWRKVMSWLCAERLADPRWGDTLLGWPGIKPWTTRPAGWPPSADRATGSGSPATARSVRRISHAKVAIDSAGRREAKLYLLVEHRILSDVSLTPPAAYPRIS